jgi:ectoine hydroxylase-related dioxygenase (phytanoyl-CoA dioxygenase family)
MPSAPAEPSFQRVPPDYPVDEILSIIAADGGVIISSLLTPCQVRCFNNELNPTLSKSPSTPSSLFNTHRLNNLVTTSPLFRATILDHDLIHALTSHAFAEESGSYWLNNAFAVDVTPGNVVHPLHRDIDHSLYPFVVMGALGPEVLLSFAVALTDACETDGAPRVIPRSNLWPDFEDRGDWDASIPVPLDAGDCLVMSGKTVHTGGYNSSKKKSRAVCFSFQPGYLTPEEAWPFLLDRKMVRVLSERVQAVLGFRSQYPRGNRGVWTGGGRELGEVLEL